MLAIPFSSPVDRRAIEASAGRRGRRAAVRVRDRAVVSTKNFLSGWAIGIALRFVTLIVYAFVAVKVLGMPAPAALISLVTFLFVSTLVEPKLLTL